MNPPNIASRRQGMGRCSIACRGLAVERCRLCGANLRAPAKSCMAVWRKLARGIDQGATFRNA